MSQQTDTLTQGDDEGLTADPHADPHAEVGAMENKQFHAEGPQAGETDCDGRVGAAVAENDELEEGMMTAGVRFENLIQGVMNQVQNDISSLGGSISEIERLASDINEGLSTAKENALLRRRQLEEKRAGFQQAACHVLDLFKSMGN
ncbi:hypothetical protein CBR_g18981 [Chara braunii]|uniref:Uncharacterized protein n=1 Tax=Chara braunii TaxID=69332 RepID=A0A388KWW8_CHABU|nr:hypothetical protein CBR_g18981 [Chara braunii]|eukprot:GBG74570.1 hypothetical protein CBR_g18981 [Chara braunii]